MRAPPRSPPAQDWIATDLPLNGSFFMREVQSMAFLSPPGMVQLYSGDTMITPSAARIASAQAVTGAGQPAS